MRDGWRHLGATSLGVWSHRQALRIMTEAQLRTRLRRGEWQAPFARVYADAGFALSPEQWAIAAIFAAGGADQPVPFGGARPDGSPRLRLVAAACGRTAARVWQIPLIDDDDALTQGQDRFRHEIHLFRSGSARPVRLLSSPTAEDPPLVDHVVARRLSLSDGDLVRLPSGLWLTSPLRTMIDCAQSLPYEAAVCALDAALQRELVTPAMLEAALSARRGRRGAARWGAVVAAADGRAESVAETLGRLVLLPALPHLVPQVRLYDSRGRIVARVDLGDEQVGFAVELDGLRGHAGPAMVHKDRARDRATAALGWWTERGSWFDVRRGQAAFRARIVAAHAQRAARAGRRPAAGG